MNGPTTEKATPTTRLPRYRRTSSPPPMQLTARDISIVRWVYEMRFLTREQIQRLEFAPSTASYCKRRLALLFHHSYLDRKFIPAPGSFGSTRAIYCIATRGARLLAHELKADINWRPKDSERELYLLRHTLATNDFRIYVILAAQRFGLTVDWVNERTLRRREMKDYVADPRHDGQRIAVVPDGYFQVAGQDKSSAFALELDRATVEEKPFKAKVRAYGEWKLTGAYRRRHGTNSLRVLFVIAPNDRDPQRLSRIKRWCEAEGGRSLFWFANASDINEHSIFTEHIWNVAGRDGRFTLLAGGETWSGGSPRPDTSSPSRPGSAPGLERP